MSSWLIFGLFAVALQTLRNAYQKSLKTHIPDEMIVLSRFLLGLPFVFIYFFIINYFEPNIPPINIKFLLFCFIAGFCQIIGNLFLIKIFASRSFVVGITYSKTEAILSAILAALLFSELLSINAIIAVILGTIGIILISVVEQNVRWHKFIKSAFNKVALLGLMCGLFYSVTAVFIRQAGLSLETDSFIVRAIITLVVTMIMQSIILLIWISIKYDLKKIIAQSKQYFKKLVIIGFSGGSASLLWFLAFMLTKSTHVVVLGQLDIIISFFVTNKIFKEHINKMEILGMVLILISILFLVII